MKKAMKLVSLMLAVVMAIIGFQTISYADQNGDYFEFTTPDQRMNPNGTFYFETRLQVFSDYFTIDNSTVTIYTHAHLYNVWNETSYLDSSVKYRITLFNSTTGTAVGRVVAACDNVGVTVEFKNVSTLGAYYLIIAPEDPGYFTRTSEQIVGYGRINDITLM